ncbi:hypothetical protein PM082_023501 [Marasmius tenuissimus]|nr:hypothetical protein PM082_023501 [Marasmius tenuissimus]
MNTGAAHMQISSAIQYIRALEIERTFANERHCRVLILEALTPKATAMKHAPSHRTGHLLVGALISEMGKHTSDRGWIDESSHRVRPPNGHRDSRLITGHHVHVRGNDVVYTSLAEPVYELVDCASMLEWWVTSSQRPFVL